MEEVSSSLPIPDAYSRTMRLAIAASQVVSADRTGKQFSTELAVASTTTAERRQHGSLRVRDNHCS